jgi:hypothetical protein
MTPAALPSTPSLPDGSRFSGMTASGPASPIRWLVDHCTLPDDLEALRRPQGDHRAGRRRRVGPRETAAGRDADPRAGGRIGGSGCWNKESTVPSWPRPKASQFPACGENGRRERKDGPHAAGAVPSPLGKCL